MARSGRRHGRGSRTQDEQRLVRAFQGRGSSDQLAPPDTAEHDALAARNEALRARKAAMEAAIEFLGSEAAAPLSTPLGR